MARILGRSNYLGWLRSWLFILVLLFFPLWLSNNLNGEIIAFSLFAILFFLPGYLICAFGKFAPGLSLLLSPVFGIVAVTTLYDVFAQPSLTIYFGCLVGVLSAAGAIALALQSKKIVSSWNPAGSEFAAAGTIVALTIAPLCWRSGRLSGGKFLFHGPAGQDPLFHVTLLQRLLYHVPPDNFIVSGLRAPVYHYFDDLALALILRSQSFWHLHSIDLFDLYYRCYPTLVYFVIGALAYRAGRLLSGTPRGGALSVFLLLGTGGLGIFLGALQTIVHASQFNAMRARLFSDWTSWDGIDSILPLVHRPAHYHGLLIGLAAINILLGTPSPRNRLAGGLLLGLMAGFNFTLSGTFGAAAVLGSIIFLLQHRKYEARDLAWLAFFIFIGSLPVTAAMVLSGFHNPAPGFPFRGPNLEFPTEIWSTLLGRFIPPSLLPLICLILFPIVAYGVKLSGLKTMIRLDLGSERTRAISMMLALVFVMSLIVGLFFPYGGMGGVAVIFIQPSLWILGLFSLHPLNAWLQRGQTRWRHIALFGILGLTWAQAMWAFNFSYEATFPQDTARALREIRLASSPDDVVAYVPSTLIQKPIWGQGEDSTNFAIMAMTGLDGYFSNEEYSTFFAVPGLSGKTSADVLGQAKHLYQTRVDNVNSFLGGQTNGEARARLVKDHVRWIVVSGDTLRVGVGTVAWRRTSDITIFRIPP